MNTYVGTCNILDKLNKYVHIRLISSYTYSTDSRSKMRIRQNWIDGVSRTESEIRYNTFSLNLYFFQSSYFLGQSNNGSQAP